MKMPIPDFRLASLTIRSDSPAGPSAADLEAAYEAWCNGLPEKLPLREHPV